MFGSHCALVPAYKYMRLYRDSLIKNILLTNAYIKTHTFILNGTETEKVHVYLIKTHLLGLYTVQAHAMYIYKVGDFFVTFKR